MEEALLGLPPFINGTFSSECDLTVSRNLYSIAAPVIIFITLCNNIVYVVLVNYIKDDRSASTVQASGIALSNTLLGISQLPVFLFFFSRSDIIKPTSSHLCNTYRILGYVLPNILHTSSVWQIVMYGIQRFLSFRWPFSALLWYKIDRFLKYTVIIYISATLIHIYKFFDFSYDTGHPCTLSYREGISQVYYVPFYQWLCAITVHLIPCIVMTVCIFLLIYAIRLNYLRRKRVFINSPTAVPRNRKFTMQECQFIGILLLVLCVEWPMTVIVLLQTINRNSSSIDCLYSPAIVSHFALLASCALYLPIYLILNFKLRNTLVQIATDMKIFFRHQNL